MLELFAWRQTKEDTSEDKKKCLLRLFQYRKRPTLRTLKRPRNQGDELRRRRRHVLLTWKEKIATFNFITIIGALLQREYSQSVSTCFRWISQDLFPDSARYRLGEDFPASESSLRWDIKGYCCRAPSSTANVISYRIGERVGMEIVHTAWSWGAIGSETLFESFERMPCCVSWDAARFSWPFFHYFYPAVRGFQQLVGRQACQRPSERATHAPHGTPNSPIAELRHIVVNRCADGERLLNTVTVTVSENYFRKLRDSSFAAVTSELEWITQVNASNSYAELDGLYPSFAEITVTKPPWFARQRCFPLCSTRRNNRLHPDASDRVLFPWDFCYLILRLRMHVNELACCL